MKSHEFEWLRKRSESKRIENAMCMNGLCAVFLIKLIQTEEIDKINSNEN